MKDGNRRTKDVRRLYHRDNKTGKVAMKVWARAFVQNKAGNEKQVDLVKGWLDAK